MDQSLSQLGGAARAVFELSLQCPAVKGQPQRGLHRSHACCERLHFNDCVRGLFFDSAQIWGMFFERRSATRKAVNTRAIVVWGDGILRAFAVILDMSETGLRIRLDHEAEIDGEGYILFDHRMEPFRVAWQASRSAGLQFTMAAEA